MIRKEKEITEYNKLKINNEKIINVKNDLNKKLRQYKIENLKLM